MSAKLLMTQAAFARHRGVVKSAASNWKKAGLLVFAEGEDGKIYVDVVRTDAKLNAKLDPMRGRPSTAGGEAPAEDPASGGELPLGDEPAAAPKATTLADERLEELRERRIGSALKNGQLARDLVPMAEAVQRVSEAGRAARERMHAWFRGEAERLAAERDVRQVMTLGEEGIDRVFDELAAAADAGEFAGDAEDELAPEEIAELEASAEAI